MTDIRQLATQLHDIAWSAVRGVASDPWADADGTREQRRDGSLQLLAIYSQMIKILRRRIDLTIKDALAAEFAERQIKFFKKQIKIHKVNIANIKRKFGG